MLRTTFLSVMSLVFLTAPSCNDSQNRKDRQSVERQQSQYATAQPIPVYDWSLERDIITQLYDARNERVTTHTVWRSDTGMIEGDCSSIGYPLPYDTSLTNPLARAYPSNSAVVEQAEPNGIFASKNSIATWVRCVVVVNGKPVEAPIYIESKVTAYPYPVEVDYDLNRAKPIEGAEPSVTIKGKTALTPPTAE